MPGDGLDAVANNSSTKFLELIDIPISTRCSKMVRRMRNLGQESTVDFLRQSNVDISYQLGGIAGHCNVPGLACAMLSAYQQRSPI
jgi:hypothetical protein